MSVTPEEHEFISEVIAEDVAKRMQPLVTLTEAMRQFRHNNSGELVAGYDYDLTRKAFNELRQQLADVTNERDGLLAEFTELADRYAALVTCEDGKLARVCAERDASEARNAEAERLLSDAGLLLALLYPEQADMDKWREAVGAWFAQSAPVAKDVVK